MIDPELLNLLRCPVTRQRLRVAPAEVLATVNSKLPQGGLAEGLMREDGRAVYPIREGIPVLLADEAIAL